MKITNNGSDTIQHITSCAQSTINSLCTKVKKLWDQLAKLFTFATNNDNHTLEKVVTIPTKQPEEMDISSIFKEPIATHPKENESLYTSLENIYEEIDCDEPIYEEISEPIYEEIPAAKALFLPKEESIYDVPTQPIYAAVIKNRDPLYDAPKNNKPVGIRLPDPLEPGIKRLISDIESHLDNAKKSIPPTLSVLEGSEISI